MNAHKQKVRKFYDTVWDLHDTRQGNNVLHTVLMQVDITVG